MADETTITQPEQVQPSWVAAQQNIVKMLLQGQQPAATPGQNLSVEQLNPWLKALEKDTTPTMNPMAPPDTSQLPAAAIGRQEISAPIPRPKPQLPAPVQPLPIGQVPVSSVMQMQQHQVNPAIEAAKQRLMQALLQQPHHIVPPVPAKG